MENIFKFLERSVSVDLRDKLICVVGRIHNPYICGIWDSEYGELMKDAKRIQSGCRHNIGYEIVVLEDQILLRIREFVENDEIVISYFKIATRPVITEAQLRFEMTNTSVAYAKDLASFARYMGQFKAPIVWGANYAEVTTLSDEKDNTFWCGGGADKCKFVGYEKYAVVYLKNACYLIVEKDDDIKNYLS